MYVIHCYTFGFSPFSALRFGKFFSHDPRQNVVENHGMAAGVLNCEEKGKNKSMFSRGPPPPTPTQYIYIRIIHLHFYTQSIVVDE